MAKKYIPKLYDSDEVTLIDDIHDVIECKIREERNGIFELTLDYPASSPLLYEFKKERVIVTNASPKLRNQMFVIYKVCRYMKKKIKVIARHISFDLLYDSCSELKLENASCEYVLNSLFRNSRFSREFRGFSDIINAQNYSIENVNILEAIAGKEGSIIDTFGTGAEILRDNKNFHVLKKRGHDNGVSIEYGINLTGFECYEDTTDLVTCIRPFATYRNEDSTETTVRGDFVESPRAVNYKHLYIKHIDYTNKFEAKEVPTPSKLNELAAQDFRTSSMDVPKMRYEIKFIPLSQCVGYENFQDAIGLCDIVTVKNRVYNVDDKAKVVATVFDPIKDRYESMELGEPRSTLGSILSGSDGKDGQNGKDGKDGKDGQDGNVENMPDTLPETPVLYSKVYGMGGVELSWSFENKLYYNYELYASRIPDFNPTSFDLIHSGQSSSHFFKANPGETWYFRVCAINSHSKRTPFSNQVVVKLPKVEDMNNYFSEMAIGRAVAQSLSADYMEAGIIKGNWIDMRHLTLTDGNGKRVVDIDDFGRAYLDVHELKIQSKNVAQTEWVQSQFKVYNDSINASVYKVASSGISNLIPFSYFNDHFTIKKHWFLNGVSWFEDGEKIGIQNIYNADGNIISEGKTVSSRTVSLYTDLDVESNVTAKVYLIGSRTDSLQYDWTLDAISYTKNESGGKKLEGITIPSHVKTIFFQVSNLGEGANTHNVVWINKLNLVDGHIARSGDLFDINQSAQLSIESESIKSEVSKKVDNDKIISTINQTAESVKILAKFLELTGYATFKDLASPGTTTIDGRNIKTGFIEAIQLIAPHITGKSRMYLEQGSVFSSDGETNVRNFYGMPGGTFDVESEATFGSIVNAVRFRTNGHYIPFSQSGYKWTVESFQGVGTETGDAIQFDMVGGTRFGVDLWWIGSGFSSRNFSNFKSIEVTNPGMDTINKLRYLNKNSLARSVFKSSLSLSSPNYVDSNIMYDDNSIPNEFTYEIEQGNGEYIRQVSPKLIFPHITLALQQQQEEIEHLKTKNIELEQKLDLILSKLG